MLYLYRQYTFHPESNSVYSCIAVVLDILICNVELHTGQFGSFRQLSNKCERYLVSQPWSQLSNIIHITVTRDCCNDIRPIPPNRC
jgi:hypothetical protein